MPENGLNSLRCVIIVLLGARDLIREINFQIGNETPENEHQSKILKNQNWHAQLWFPKTSYLIFRPVLISLSAMSQISDVSVQ